MASLSWHQFLVNLRTDLEARPNLAGVKIRTMPQSPDQDPYEGVIIDRVNGGHEYLTHGPNFIDGFEVQGRMWARAAETGDEPGIASRSRIETMLEELTTVCATTTSTIYSQALDAVVSSWEYQPMVAEDGGGWASLRFTLSARSLV